MTYNVVNLQAPAGTGSTLAGALNASGETAGYAVVNNGTYEDVLWSATGAATILQPVDDYRATFKNTFRPTQTGIEAGTKRNQVVKLVLF